jgi:hypothetical protein
MKRLFVLSMIAAALVVGIASESEAACRRVRGGGFLSRIFHRGERGHAFAGGCASCQR